MFVNLVRALAVLVTTAVIAVTAASRYLLSPERVDTYLLAPLERGLGRSLEVGRVGLWPGGLVAWDVRLGEDPRLATAPDDWSASAERVMIGLDFGALLTGQLLIKNVSIHSPHLRLVRARDGSWNTASLVAGPKQGDAGDDAGPPPRSIGLHVERVRVRGGSVELRDKRAEPAVDLSCDLSDLSGNIVRRHDGHIDLAVSGQFRRGRNDPRDVSLNGRIDTARGITELDVNAERIALAGVSVQAVSGSLRLRKDRIDVLGMRGRAAAGEVSATGSITLSDDGPAYTGKVELGGIDLAELCAGLSETAEACVPGTADLVAEVAARGSTREAFLDSIGLGSNPTGQGRLRLSGSVQLQSLDLAALDRRPSPPLEGEQPAHELGPFRTGAIQADISFRADEIRHGDFAVSTVAGRAELDGPRLTLHQVTAEAAGGAMALDGSVDLGVEGLAYEGNVSLEQGNLAILSDLLPQPAWGDRSGLVDLAFSFSGRGTTPASALAALKAGGEVSIPTGWVRDSTIFHSVGERTGIEGFSSLFIADGGGHLAIDGGRVSSGRVVLGNDEARLLARGWIGFDKRLDIELWVGVGPHRERRLLSRGILLPYMMDSGGWTNVPLHLSGRLGKVETSVVYEAYAGTAVRAVPDSAGRIVQESTGAVIDGLRELLGGLGRVVTGEPGEGSPRVVRRGPRSGRTGVAKRQTEQPTDEATAPQ